MLIYNIVFSVNFLLALININYTKKSYIYISFVLLSTFLCLNYTNGIDWIQYQLNFLEILSLDEIIQTKNYYANIPERNRDEIFFYYSMSLFKMFNINYEIYQYIMLSFVMIIMYRLILRFTEYPLFGILIYYSYFMLGNFFEPTLRQFLAMAMFYIGIGDILNRNFIKYFIKILLAYLFHSSGLILLLIYFIPLKRIKNSIILFGFFIFILGERYLKTILELVSRIAPILSKYLVYFDIEEYGIQDNINLIFFIKILTSIFIGIYIDKNKKYLTIKNEKIFCMILNFYWLNEGLFILKRQMIIFYRLQYYFEIFYVIGLTFLLEILVKKYGKKLGIMILILYSLVYYRVMYLGIVDWKNKDTMKFFPYTNYISEILFNPNIKKGYEKINYRLNSRQIEMQKNMKE